MKVSFHITAAQEATRKAPPGWGRSENSWEGFLQEDKTTGVSIMFPHNEK